MLFKRVLPQLVTFLGTQIKHSKPVWCYSVRRYAGAGPSDTSGNKADWHHEEHTCQQLDSRHHSPINIITSKSVFREYSPLSLHLYDNPNIEMILQNNGHTVQVSLPTHQLEVTGAGLITQYRTHHLHFHWGSDNEAGSEHYIDNSNFPMEMHIVHFNTMYQNLPSALNQRTGLAVTAFLFEIASQDNQALAPLITKLPFVRKPYSSTPLKLPALSCLLPDNLENFYQYSDASMSVYPRIIWTVFKDTIKISESQIEQFRSLESNETDPATRQPKRLGDNNRNPEEIPFLYVFRSFGGDPEEEIDNVQQMSKKQGKMGAFGALIYKLVCGGKKKPRK